MTLAAAIDCFQEPVCGLKSALSSQDPEVLKSMHYRICCLVTFWLSFELFQFNFLTKQTLGALILGWNIMMWLKNVRFAVNSLSSVHPSLCKWEQQEESVLLPSATPAEGQPKHPWISVWKPGLALCCAAPTIPHPHSAPAEILEMPSEISSLAMTPPPDFPAWGVTLLLTLFMSWIHLPLCGFKSSSKGQPHAKI